MCCLKILVALHTPPRNHHIALLRMDLLHPLALKLIFCANSLIDPNSLQYILEGRRIHKLSGTHAIYCARVVRAST